MRVSFSPELKLDLSSLVTKKLGGLGRVRVLETYNLFFRALLRHSGMSTPASASGHYSKYYIHMIPKTVSIVPCLQIELYYYWISFEIQPDSEAEEAWERPRRHNKPGSPPRLTHILEISS